MKLLCSLVVWQQILLYVLPGGSRVNGLCRIALWAILAFLPGKVEVHVD